MQKQKSNKDIATNNNVITPNNNDNKHSNNNDFNILSEPTQTQTKQQTVQPPKAKEENLLDLL